MIELKRKSTRGTSSFRYRLSGENSLVESQVAKLAEIEKSLFLPFTSEVTPDGAVELHFDVARMVPFGDWAEEQRSAAEVRRLCCDIAWAIDTCVECGLPLKNIELDPSLLFYDSWRQAFRFVYLPAEGIEPDASKVQSFALDILGRLLSSEENGAQVSFHVRQLVCADEARIDPLMVAQIMRIESRGGGDGKSLIAQELSASKEKPQPASAVPGPSSERPIVSQPLSARTKRYPWEDDVFVEQGGFGEKQPAAPVAVSDRPKSERTRTGQGKASEAKSAEKPKSGTVSLDFLAQEEKGFPKGTVVLGLFDEDESESFDVDDSSGKELESAADVSPETGLGEQEQKCIPSSGLEEESEGATTLLAPEEQFEYALVRLKTNERISIPEGRFVVGKSKYSDYRIAGNTTVSRLHAVFSRADERCWVEDSKSLNGTFVNNAKLAPAARMQISPGDVVRMSDEDFLFEKVQRAIGRG